MTRSSNAGAAFWRVLFPISLLVLSFLLAFPSWSFPETKTDAGGAFRIQKLELLNGLRTLIIERSPPPTVAVNLTVRAGSMVDPLSQSGLAYLTAQSLFASNRRNTPEQWKGNLERLGAEFKIRLEAEAVVFQATVPAENLESYLGDLSLMLLHPLFEQESLEQLKKHAIEQDLQDPLSINAADRYFRALIFGKHPYGKPLWGDAETFKFIQADDVKRFYDLFYRPDNAALAVVGAVASSDVMTWIREKWGNWTKGKRPEVLLPRLTVRDNFSVHLLERGESPWATIVYGQLGPSRLTTDFFCLKVLNALLGAAGSTSLLAKEFQARHLDQQSLLSQFRFYETAGMFQVKAVVPEAQALPALQAISSTIDSLKQNRVSDAELRSASAALVQEFSESLKSVSHVADYATEMELYDLAPDFLLTYPSRIEQVSSQRIQEAARTYLDTSRSVAVVVGNSTRLAPELNKAGPVEVIMPTNK